MIWKIRKLKNSEMDDFFDLEVSQEDDKEAIKEATNKRLELIVKGWENCDQPFSVEAIHDQAELGAIAELIHFGLGQNMLDKDSAKKSE